MAQRRMLESAEPLTCQTRCAYCRIPYWKNNLFGRMAFHVDHVIPRSKPPPPGNELSNLVWACLVCNSHKAAFTEGYDHVTNSAVPLFHPRAQAWASHFQGLANGKINGLTTTGRGTEARLQFNGEAIIIAARESLFAEEWWPALDQQ